MDQHVSQVRTFKVVYFCGQSAPCQIWRSKPVHALHCSSFLPAGSISGDNFDIPRVPHDLLRPIQSTAPAGPWLFPTPDIWQDKVVVETQGGDQYTTKDIEQMLRDLHLLQQVSCYMAMLRQNHVHGLNSANMSRV